jgi:hypothetical protein
MGMLDRIKKKKFVGFKEFVLNMETSGQSSRQLILMRGILEDPVFMANVMKNVRTFDDFLNLPSDEIDTVIKTQDQILGVLAKCFFGSPQSEISAFESMIPKYISRLKDELAYLTEVTPSEKEGAKYFILKLVRKLQMAETIQGFAWRLPPLEIFHPKVYKDGPTQIYFESSILAAEGDTLRGKRTNRWKHFYDSGKLLAQGEYHDGLKTGVWVFYFGNGSIKSQGDYKLDLKHGMWKDWDRAGVMSETDYIEGVKKA